MSRHDELCGELYASTGWTIGDVFTESADMGVSMSNAEARDLLLTNQGKIVDAMVSAGWEAIRFHIDELKRKREEELDG